VLLVAQAATVMVRLVLRAVQAVVATPLPQVVLERQAKATQAVVVSAATAVAVAVKAALAAHQRQVERVLRTIMTVCLRPMRLVALVRQAHLMQVRLTRATAVRRLLAVRAFLSSDG
jgi:hypothetical protein